MSQKNNTELAQFIEKLQASGHGKQATAIEINTHKNSPVGLERWVMQLVKNLGGDDGLNLTDWYRTLDALDLITPRERHVLPR